MVIDIEKIKHTALFAIGNIKPANAETKAERNFRFRAERTNAGRSLPPYYLVYYLLVELLGFEDLGKSDKTAWSIPLDYNGQAYLIEYRKMGLGIFTDNTEKKEAEAAEIVKLIRKGIKVAKPYFESIARQAEEKSILNVTNVGIPLFNRFQFFLKQYNQKLEATKNITAQNSTRSIFYPNEESGWLAMAAIEAFFSWTEHIFIHIAILKGKVTSGKEVSELAIAEWGTKYKSALSLDDKTDKDFFDKLLEIRKQMRNFIAHGAFGKEGEAFSFHSKVGAVPFVLEGKQGKYLLSFRENISFRDEDAIKTIEDFIVQLWSGDREPAKLYIQESGLPLILPMATNGQYEQAMSTIAEMDRFLNYLTELFDNAANMDF
jgi:hypothetical protein